MPSTKSATGHRTRMSRVAETALIASAQAGGTSAVETLVTHYTPNVWALAHELGRSFPAAEVEDLAQEGLLTLLEAIHRFDISEPGFLWGYASIRVRSAMLEAAQLSGRCVTVPRGTLNNRGNLSPSGQQALDRALEAPAAIVPMDDEDPLPAGCVSAEAIVYDPTPSRATDAKAMVARFLGYLGPREREVVRLAYGLEGLEPLADGDIASRLGISRTRVNRIRNAALDTIRDAYLAERNLGPTPEVTDLAEVLAS